MTHTRIIAPLLFAGLLTVSPLALSQDSFAPGGSYGAKVGHKALNAFTNITTSVLELPKNIINVSNQSNIFYGVTGGLFKGIVNMAGRIGVGVADLVTFPLPTQPIAQPVYIWNDFDMDTSYGEAFRLDRSPARQQAAPLPVAETVVAPPPVAAEPETDYSEQYQETYPDPNEKLDAFFKKEMMK
ncbi:MAG: exosortase system-associated protein, TIGR04073 family [Gammaproteobacteria bacterium]